MIRRSTLLALEVAAGLAATAAIGIGVLFWRLSSGPIELSEVRATIEQQLSAARGGRPVKIGQVELAWQPGRPLEVRASDVRALDSAGRVLSRSDSVTVGLGADTLMFGRLSVVEAHFHGGAITFTSKKDGSAEVAFGPPGAPADIVLPPSKENAPLTQRVNRALDGLAAAFRPVGPGGRLRDVSVDRALLTVVDEKNNARWVGDDAAFAMQHEKEALTFRASASPNGPEGSAPFALAIATDPSFQAADIQLTITKVRPQALLPSLGALEGLTTPVTLAIDAGLDRKRGVTKLNGEATLGAGSLTSGGGKLDLSGGKLTGRYDLAADTLYVSQLTLAGAKTAVRGSAKLQHASAILADKPAAPARFEIAAPRIDFEMPGAFAGPVTFDNVVAAGAIKPEQSSIEIEKFEASAERARVRVAGRVYWADDGAGAARMGAKLDGVVEGVVTPATVVRYWPMNVGASARSWCEWALKGGRLSNAKLMIDFSPKDLAKGGLANEKLALDFDFDQASVLYVDGMTPLTNGAGHATLRGDSFSATIESAAIGDIALSRGKVTLPTLRANAAPAVYQGHAQGTARSVVKLLLQAPIGLEQRLPFVTETIVGDGQADFSIRRPLGAGVPGDATAFSVDGKFEKVGGLARNGDYSISNWTLRAKGDDNALNFAGPMTLAHSTAELNWTERVRAKSDQSNVQLKGRLSADDLITLGFPILKYADGPVVVDARSIGTGLDINKGDVKMDFTGATVNMERGFWKKPSGEPLAVEFAVARQPDKSLVLSGLRARGGDVNVNGDVQVSEMGDLIRADMPKAFLPGAADAAVTARRDQAGVLQVQINGAFLNIGAFFAPEPPNAPSADEMLSTAQSYDEKTMLLSPAYDIAGDLQRLRFRNDGDIAKAKLAFSWDGKSMRRLSAIGSDTKSQPFELSILPKQGPAQANQGVVTLKSADAGLAARALLGVDNVRGGQVEASGAWTFGENPSGTFNVKARNFLVAKVPAMAHLLSSVGSLTGLVEALNGQGITFTSLDAPVTLANGKLSLAETRAAGPSLGITAKGGVDLYTGTMNVDGVLVPSYGLNSFLGNLPILGDLITSRKGEGIFGITYQASGPADNPRVMVNPLSAVMPGILRRIFEPVRRSPPAEIAEKQSLTRARE